jgi:hypothetical protein
MSSLGNHPSFISVQHKPQSADPTNPREGDVFRSDGTSRAKGLWEYRDGAWIKLLTGGEVTIATVTANYTALITDQVILCNATSGLLTVSLYTAVGNEGRVLEIKKIDTSTNRVVIDPSGVETVDGRSTIAMRFRGDSIKLVSNGVEWAILTDSRKPVLENFHFDTYLTNGVTATRVPLLANQRVNTTGDAVTLTNTAANGFRITANGDRVEVDMTYFFTGDGATISFVGITRNSTNLTTSVAGLAGTNELKALAMTPGAGNQENSVNFNDFLNVNDFISPHAEGKDMSDAARCIIIGKAKAEQIDLDV